MTDSTAPAPEAPVTTQQRHPWRATARTAVALILGGLSALATVALVAVPVVDEELGAWDVATPLGQTLIVATIITRIMALPAVDRALESIGLGSSPVVGKHSRN